MSGKFGVFAKNGMVASSQPLATLAGVQMLLSGGNAIDAAVATAAGLAILWPRWRWIFYLAAALVAAERVLENAHWLSDTVGAAGLAVCGVHLMWRIILPWVTATPQRLQRASGATGRARRLPQRAHRKTSCDAIRLGVFGPAASCSCRPGARSCFGGRGAAGPRGPRGLFSSW